MKRILILLITFTSSLFVSAQEQKKVYDELINPMSQIDAALAQASDNGKFVICQIGGNWCKWCLRFADFISEDKEIADFVATNFVYIHVNVPRRGGDSSGADAMRRLGNPYRFGYPVMVVLDGKGNILHIQDSSFLEEGDSYDKSKVMRFFRNWTPGAVKEAKTR